MFMNLITDKNKIKIKLEFVNSSAYISNLYF